jgi:hypothetical protein
VVGSGLASGIAGRLGCLLPVPSMPRFAGVWARIGHRDRLALPSGPRRIGGSDGRVPVRAETVDGVAAAQKRDMRESSERARISAAPSKCLSPSPFVRRRRACEALN